MQYNIKFGDGTSLKNLELNGNNFITDEEIDESYFTETKLNYVEITSDEGKTETYYDMMLIQCRKWNGDKTWFIIAQKTEDQKKEEALTKENILLKAQIKALDENCSFLEDCLIEIGQVVYA